MDRSTYHRERLEWGRNNGVLTCAVVTGIILVFAGSALAQQAPLPAPSDKDPVPPAPDPASLGKVPNQANLGKGIPAFKSSTPVAGKEASPFHEALTLKEAIEIAVLRNRDLLVTKTNIDQGRATPLMAQEFPNPTVSLSTAKMASYGISTTLGNSIFQRSYDSIAAVSQFIEIGGKQRFPGKILKVGDMLDPSTRTAKNVVEVPSKAVLFVDNKHYTFVETSPGHFMRREVVVSDDHDERAFITKGIRVGERVVEDGGLYLQAIADNADG